MGENFLTIGQVVEKLKSSFPDLSISKVRYLEEEGLITPQRTAGGYRKFSQNDLKQLEIVLKFQREQFLPLSIIKEKLKTLRPNELIPEVKTPKKEAFLSFTKDNKHFSLEDISQKTGVSGQEIQNLEAYNLLKPKETAEGKSYNSSDLKLVHLAKEFSRFGLEPRHLRMFEAFAQKEASLLWQILLPPLKTLKPEKRQKILANLSELLSQSQELKDLLLNRALHHYFGGF